MASTKKRTSVTKLRPGQYKRTAAHRRNLSHIAKKRVGPKNPFFGKKHTEATKSAIGFARTGVKRNSRQRARHRRKYHDGWIKAHPERVAAYDKRSLMPRALANARRRKNLRRTMIAALGGRCSSPTCGWVNSDGSRGCTDFRALQADHVHGGGTKERKLISHEKLMKKITNDKTGQYQCLCANCNWIKVHTHKESNRKYQDTEIL